MWRHPPFSRGASALPDDRPAPRKPRADAARNRQRLVEAAKERFAAEGTGASLEEIARAAGVGIGTLYRNFPTRDALVAEVYRQEIGRLFESAGALADKLPPLDALRQWLLLFVDYLATKKIMADALATLVDADLSAASARMLDEAVTRLTDRAMDDRAIRLTVPPLDLLRAIAGVANASPGAAWDASARAMVDVLLAGMRPTA